MTAGRRRIYFVSDNLGLLVEWLRGRPEGRFQVLIGDVSTPEQKGISERVLGLLGDDRDLAKWLAGKLRSGDFDIRATTARLDIPEGLAL